MRSTLFLVTVALIMVVVCWAVKYGGVEDVAVRVVDKSSGNTIDECFVFYHSRPDSNWGRSPEIRRTVHETIHPIEREDLTRFDVWFAASGHRPHLLRPSDLSWSSWLRFGESVLALEPGPNLKGTVRDAAGRPVADALILTEMRPLIEGSSLPEAVAHTCKDGGFECPDIPAFIEDVKAFKEGLGVGHCTVSDSMEFVIVSGALACRMLDGGKPIAGLWVIAEACSHEKSPDSSWWHATQKTNAQGEAQFTEFPTGEAAIRAQQYFQDGAWRDYYRFGDKGGDPDSSQTVVMCPKAERDFYAGVEVQPERAASCTMDAPAVEGDLTGSVLMNSKPIHDSSLQAIHYTALSPSGDVCMTGNTGIEDGHFSFSPFPRGDVLAEAVCYSASGRKPWSKTLWLPNGESTKVPLQIDLKEASRELRVKIPIERDGRHVGISVFPADVPLDRIPFLVKNNPARLAHKVATEEHVLSIPCTEGRHVVVVYERFSRGKILGVKEIEVGDRNEPTVAFE